MFASFSLSSSLYFFLFSFSLPHFLSLSLPFSPFLISPSPIRSFSQCTRISNRRRNLNTTARRGTFHFFFSAFFLHSPIPYLTWRRSKVASTIFFLLSCRSINTNNRDDHCICISFLLPFSLLLIFPSFSAQSFLFSKIETREKLPRAT